MGIMERDRFWAIVDEARTGVADTRTGEGAEEVATRVDERLVELGRETAVAFALRYDLLMAESYDWNLWGAAYLMKGGCSDDAFDYFRGWLVTQGRDTWERAVRDPDTLADLGIDPDDDFLESEEMLHVGSQGSDDVHAAVTAERAAAPEGTFDLPDLDDDFDHEDDDQVRARFPRLAAIYLE